MNLGKTLTVALLVVWSPARAQDFQVDSVIHPVVAKLGEPTRSLSDPMVFAISTSSVKAADYVKKGLVSMNSPWDFEAYRHFCAAAQEDPHCLMAYWGIVMSLAGNQTEFYDQRKAATERLLGLLEMDPPIGVEIERAYALAAVNLIAEGPRAASEIFLNISENFPGDFQSKMLGLFLSRDGYDSKGRPKVRQEQVNEELKKLALQHPENVMLSSFWLSSLSEAPLTAIDLKTDAVSTVRSLVKRQPDYAPYQLTAADFEARCGNAKRAIHHAKKARDLFERYMQQEKVTVYDCGGWIRAQIYLANLYAVKGEFQKALPIIQELATYQIDEARVFSQGASLLLWEGRTLGGRLAASRETSADLEAGIKSMSLLSKEQWFEEESYAGNYRDGLVLYLGARKALAAKDQKAAKALHIQLMQRGSVMARQRLLAQATSSYSEWYRAASTLGLLASELQGLMAEQDTGAGKLAAVNWYRAAIDQQELPSSFLPPSLSYPIELRLGKFYLSQGEKVKALDTFAEGLRQRPNHLGTLKGYREAFERLGKKEEVAQVTEIINVVLK